MTKVGVGPVFIKGKIPDLWIRAFREVNPDLSITDHGSYLRIAAPKSCIVTKTALESHLGGPINLSLAIGDIMVSFSGSIAIDDDRIIWSDT